MSPDKRPSAHIKRKPVYACIYIPDFEAWVFQRAEGFRGPLVAVASGLVVAATHAARRSGIEPGITEARASALCPDVAIRLRDYGLEQAVWEDTLLRIHATTPFLEDSAPPFAWLSPGEPTSLRALVRGFGIRAGIAPLRSFAQLSAMRAAPGNTLVLREEHFGTFLGRFEVERLAAMGFGTTLLEQLELLGYKTLEAASTLSRPHLNAQFGKEGDRLFTLLHPESERPVPLYTPAPVITYAYECEPTCSEPGELWPIVEHLADEVCLNLDGRRCQRITLSLQQRGESEPLRRSRIVSEPLGKRSSLLNTTRILMNSALHDHLEVERVSLELGTLKHPVPRQKTLFSERPSVYTAVRSVNKRFPGILKRAVLQRGTLFLDEAVRFEPFPDQPGGRIKQP